MATAKTFRPRILVSGPDRGGLLAWLFTRVAVYRAGGSPVRVTPSRAPDIPAFDGLIIGGGADIAPDLYGQSVRLPQPRRQQSPGRWLLALLLYPLLFLLRRLFSAKHYSGLDNGRDILEYRLLQCAIESGKPVLGICRGAQLINVFHDGDLHQDMSGFYTESPQAWSFLPVKVIEISPGSQLRELLGSDDCKVNALHKQCIDKPGAGIRISARERNGVAQAIEATDHDFVIGVQWHPEYLPHHARQQRLFHGLVERAQAGNDKRTDIYREVPLP